MNGTWMAVIGSINIPLGNRHSRLTLSGLVLGQTEPPPDLAPRSCIMSRIFTFVVNYFQARQ